MSVYKSRRKDNKAEFIADAAALRIKTIQIIKRMPKSYRWIFTNKILEHVTDIFDNCIQGNAVFMHKDMLFEDFITRRKHFMDAYTALDALSAEISFCYSIIIQGENVFKSRADRNRKFEAWVNLTESTKVKLKALMKSDKERYAGYQ